MPDTRGLYTSIIRVVIQLAVLAIANWLLTELPMIKAVVIPELPVPITAIISFIIGLGAIGVLLLFRRDFISRLRSSYPSFPQAATIASEGIILAIIVIAYTSFSACVQPLMKQFAWLYPVIFLAVALWPLIMLINTLYRSSGPIADWASTKLAGPPAVTENVAKCGSCGKLSPVSARFCPSCGCGIESSACSKCLQCGAVVKEQDKYCMLCGTRVEGNDQFDTKVSVE